MTPKVPEHRAGRPRGVTRTQAPKSACTRATRSDSICHVDLSEVAAEKVPKSFARVVTAVIRVVVRRLVANVVSVGRGQVEPTASSQHARRLRNESLVAFDVLDDFNADHSVEGLARQAATGHVFEHHSGHI